MGKYRRIINYMLCIACNFTCIHLNAQDKILEPGLLKCTYLESVVVDTVSRRAVPDTLYLYVGPHLSAFYSQDRFFVDSLLSCEGGVAKLRTLQVQYARERRIFELTSNTAEYIYQNYPEGYTTTRALIGETPVEITEKREVPAWEMKDSTKQILGYECRMAEAYFRGRNWIAWFAPAIPSNSGPWKLWGLPGLILEASDTHQDYFYTMIGIHPCGESNIILYNKPAGNYKKVDRIQYLKGKDARSELMGKKSRAMGFGSISGGYAPRERDYK